MTFVFVLLPLVLSFFLLAAGVKLAFFLRRRAKIAWKHSFVYVFLLLLIVSVVRLTLARTGIVVPFLVGVLFGLLSQLALGSYYFANRATTREGVQIGRKGGAQVAGIFFGLVDFIAGVAQFVIHKFLPGAS